MILQIKKKYATEIYNISYTSNLGFINYKNNQVTASENIHIYAPLYSTSVNQTNIRNNELLVNNIMDFIKKKNVKIDDKFSVLVNLGPGSFTSIRVSLAVAKGINITKKASLYGYKDSDLTALNLKNIDLLIKKNLIENKLIKPVYIS